MKRPLLWGCVGLVLIILARHLSVPDSTQRPPGIDDSGQIRIVGKIYEMNQKNVILNSICVLQETNQKENQFIQLNNSKKLPKNNKITCDINNVDKENSELVPGSYVLIQGDYQTLKSATNLGEFDEKQYYDSIGVIGKAKKIKVCETVAKASAFRRGLYRIQNSAERKIERWFMPKEAGVLKKMILGDASDLEAETKELYSSNGIIHILSISGLHITLLGMGLFKILRKIGAPIWLAALLGGCVILSYGIMVGLSVSVARAIGMYLIRMFSVLNGRTYDSLTALAVIAVLLIFIHPYYVENQGFLFSFASLVGILVVYPNLIQQHSTVIQIVKKKEKEFKTDDNAPGCCENRVYEKVKTVFKNKIGTALLGSFSITLMTLPIQLYFSYEVSVYAPVLNLLILPFMGALLLGSVTFLVFPGARIFTLVPSYILQYNEVCCRMFQKLPYYIWNPGKPALWQIAVYYFLLILWIGPGTWMLQRVLKGSDTY